VQWTVNSQATPLRVSSVKPRISSKFNSSAFVSFSPTDPPLIGQAGIGRWGDGVLGGWTADDHGGRGEVSIVDGKSWRRGGWTTRMDA